VRRHHLDRRALQLLALATPAAPPATPINDDDLLTTQQVAAWLGVSDQWLELGRKKGYGPNWTKLGPRCIRYTRGNVIKWLKGRARHG
jgi:predicted DNA-binding transcriptional regulator AlpA